MKLFGKKIIKSPREKEAELLPRNKKVQYVYRKSADVKSALDADLNDVLNFEPVNYYAEKLKFTQLTFFYEEDFSRIMLLFEEYINDKPTGEKLWYDGNYELMKGILRRFGQNI